jgi:transcription elongation GreA/GreB family factor
MSLDPERRHYDHLGHINRMTSYTHSLLQKKLVALKVQDEQFSLDIGEAGGTNDFHDNFAFDEANRLHEGALAQVAELEKQLRDVEIVSPRQDIESIGVGNEVNLAFDGENPFAVTVLCPLDASVNREGWISYKSVLGDALLGHKAGDTIKIPKRDDLGRTIGIYSVTVFSIAQGKF